MNLEGSLTIRFVLLAISLHPLWGQEANFGSGLYRIMEKAACRSCHNADGVASATRLHFPPADASPERIEAFGKSLVVLVDREHPDNSLLFNKPTARIAHTGGERIKPGSPEDAVLKAWILNLSKLSGPELATALKYREDEGAGTASTQPQLNLRRLTHSQYNHTVRDLLGDQTAPSDQFPPEDFINGFRDQTRGQNLSPLLIEAYRISAEKLARNAFRGGDTHNLIPCKPSAACRTQFVKEFGFKAFRRPLDAGEQKRYETLMRTEPDFVKGAQLTIEAMLQSPNFLFRLDETSDPAAKPYAAASRLSYAIWDTMPDAELFQEAAKGGLSTPQGVDKTARRLLADPRAKEALNEYVSQWLRFDRLLSATKDRRKFPLFQTETARSATEEARTFVSDLVWNDRNFMDFYTANYGFVNVELAPDLKGGVTPAKENSDLGGNAGRVGPVGHPEPGAVPGAHRQA